LKKSFNKRKNKSKTLIEDGIEGQKNKTKELGKKIKKNKNKDQNKKIKYMRNCNLRTRLKKKL
jgi:hypothetical protein